MIRGKREDNSKLVDWNDEMSKFLFYLLYFYDFCHKLIPVSRQEDQIYNMSECRWYVSEDNTSLFFGVYNQMVINECVISTLNLHTVRER